MTTPVSRVSGADASGRYAPSTINPGKSLLHHSGEHDPCPLCQGPVMVMFECDQIDLYNMLRLKTDMHASSSVRGFKILKTLPKPEEPEIHEHYPERIKVLFSDLQDMARQNRTPSLIVTGCRSVLEVACGELGGEGKNFFSRIDDLLAKNILTQPLADWAHRLRLDGNAAVHEIEATPEQATELIEFIKLFLEVTFVLPRRIAAKVQSPEPS